MKRKYNNKSKNKKVDDKTIENTEKQKKNQRGFYIYQKYNDWIITDYSLQKNREISKFYYRRHFLFSKIESGIIMDYESWFSVTPEFLVKKIINILTQVLPSNKKEVLCGYCGVGGDVVVFLKYGFDVLACDILYSKIKYLKINSSIYKKEQDKKYTYGNLSCEVSDFLTLNVDRKYEYGFLSPPWGGMNYKNSTLFDLCAIGFDKITTKSQSIIKNCVYFLPKNSNLHQIEEILKDSITVNILFQERILGLLVFHGDDFLMNKDEICLAFKQ